ncbi:MAG: trypsin-like peptidase domain-containing protein [Pseudomonadota bacterium]
MTNFISALFSLFLITLTVSPLNAQSVPTSQAQIAMSFVPVVKKATPAVVNIYARRAVQARQSPFLGDPFFDRFFREFGQARPQVQNSLGSGVILTESGIIVSNYHVVGDATEIRVVLSDRREFSAEVLLGDEDSDLAILKLDTDEALPFLTMRDSDTVEVGELALAIGNPFGVGQTVSSGIVSGLARSGIATGSARGYFLQTDAPINPGNSGGALVDLNGDLIGINTAILTRSGGSNGIGFAIPTNLVAQFVAQAEAGNRRFERPWAGITGQPVTSDLAEALGLAIPEGIVIADLHPLSPFAEAGFVPGDVITGVNGQSVNTPAEMVYHMSVIGIAATLDVAYLRATTMSTRTVDLIAPPEDPPRNTTRVPPGITLQGLTVANANPALEIELNLPPDQNGVLVLNPGPIGARVGIRAGDRIITINQIEIREASEVPKALAGSQRSVAVNVERKGRRFALRARL